MHPAGQVIEGVLYVFLLLLMVRFVVDLVQMFARSWHPRGVLLVVLEGVFSVTDPPIKAVRRVIPPLRLGGMMLDLSFVVVWLLTYVLLTVNRSLWQ